MKTPFIHITTLLFSAVLPLAAAEPQIINYHGKIAVGSTPFAGTGQFRIALVNGNGNTSYWSNDGISTAGSLTGVIETWIALRRHCGHKP